MIRLLSLPTRKPRLTHAQFADYWLTMHGPLALAVPGVRRHGQPHISGTRSQPGIADTDGEVDGFAEL